jgi:hypothetical protein
LDIRNIISGPIKTVPGGDHTVAEAQTMSAALGRCAGAIATAPAAAKA